ncbi:MAG TPA: PKD domain-containing protein, partial [Chitinophagaceae bacterium]|nr:PKD domain-containing protein [Chitinophagaceae bacterium]
MKKLTCFALASLLLLQHNPAGAQTCSAAFTWSLGSNKTVGFYAADSIGLANRWVFGDGSQQTTTGFAITHAYAQPGQYEVRHYTERPGTGCHDSLVKIITIPADSCSITARFGYWKDTFDCKKIHFINYSAPISANAHYSWKFGDGSTSTDGNPVHAYAQAGKYYVCLVSEAGANCRASYCDSVIVRCSDSCAIQPYFNWTADSAAVNKIHFQNYT